MRVPPLTLRQTKGSPLTAAEFDKNLTTLRDFCNGLSARLDVVLNANGSLRDGSVSTSALADRCVTQRKLAWTANFFGVATGTNTYAVQIQPTASFAYGDGTTVAFLCNIRFTNANSGPSTLDVNSAGPKSIKKYGSLDLSAGDIAAGGVYTLMFDGTNFQMLTPSALTIDTPDRLAIVQYQLTKIPTSDNSGANYVTIDSNPMPNTEGKQYTTYNFTPKLANSKILVEFECYTYCISGDGDSVTPFRIGLFKDADAASFGLMQSIAGPAATLHKTTGLLDSTATDQITFKVRWGSAEINGDVGIVAATTTGWGGPGAPGSGSLLKVTEYLA